MTFIDLDGKVIQVTDLPLALLQADDYRHYRHTTAGFEQFDANMKRYWEDVYQKLLKLKETGGSDGKD